MSRKTRKPDYLGFGLGLRTDHYEEILSTRPDVDWFEVLSENYMVPGGKPLHYLERIREQYPVVMHGVSLSIGSSDPLNQDYLKQLKTLADRIEPKWVSDHLCWTGVEGLNLHDLMPLPYTEEAIKHVAQRVKQVQDHLGRRFLLENVSSYVTYKHSRLTEWEFLSAIAQEADCLILLDINNIYVSSFNHGFDPQDYLNGIPVERVQQHHLAGHLNCGNYIVDTHDHPVIDPVWDLYAKAVQRFGPVSTIIERDDNIPPLADLLAELNHARRIAQPILAQARTQTRAA
ncbi:MAG: MNIO family bufferin maturase [Burkholderiales bacterium]